VSTSVSQTIGIHPYILGAHPYECIDDQLSLHSTHLFASALLEYITLRDMVAVSSIGVSW
jgi:hypothetical protein